MAESITLQTSDNNVQQSDVLGRLSFAASNESSGSDARLIGASIYASAESDFTAISNATSLIFATASSENAAERMRITSGGNVGIGTSTPQATLDVNGTVQFDNLIRWEYPDKALDANVATLGYIRLYDEVGAYAGLGVSASSFNVGTSGAINVRTITNGAERSIIDTNGNFIFNDAGNNCDFRVEGDTDQYLFFTDASTDRVSVGSASLGKFNVTDSSTNTSYRYLNYCYGSHTSSTNGTYYVFGDNINVYKLVNSGITDTGYAMGSEIVSVLNGNGTLTSTYGLRTYAGIHTGSSAGTNTVAYGIQSRVINFGSGSSLIGEARGVDIYINGDLGNNKTSAGITTAKALNIGSILDATNKWAIYQEGANDKNYLNGSVGIGTSPASKLHVLSAKDATYGNFFIQDSTASAAGVGASIIFGGKHTSGGAYARFGEIKAIKENSTDGNYDSALVFSTNDMSTLGERVRIDHNGNVGIGTPSPSYKLDVNGTFSANSINVNDQFTFPTADGSSGQALITDGAGNVSWTNIVLNQTVNGRLTLESGVPISTTGQTAKTTLYFTPYLGNQIALYNGTEWKIYSFSELSLSLSGYTANTNYDIFIYDNSGTLTLESTAWSNNTTRATSLTTQDGVYVKSGATTRRYLGTIRITGTTGQCEDSASRRFVWNLYNQVPKLTSVAYVASHSYTTAAWRPWNNNTTVGQARAEFIRGLNLSMLQTEVWAEAIGGYTSLVIDQTNVGSYYTKAGNSVAANPTTAGDVSVKYLSVAEGYHYGQATQFGAAGCNFYSLFTQITFLG